MSRPLILVIFREIISPLTVIRAALINSNIPFIVITAVGVSTESQLP